MAAQSSELTAVQLRALVKYLLGLKDVIAGAVEARRYFVREMGMLIEQARLGNQQAVAQQTGRVGREQIIKFREAKLGVQRLNPPGACEQCQEAVAGWVDMHVSACDVMIEAGTSGDLKRLHEAQNLLAEGRRFASRFNAEYQRLSSVVRTRTEELRRAQARREREREAARATRRQT